MLRQSFFKPCTFSIMVSCCVAYAGPRGTQAEKGPFSVELVSCFLGKVIFEHRDRTSKWARDPKVLSGRDSTPVQNARKTRAVGAASGKSLYGWSDWWSN